MSADSDAIFVGDTHFDGFINRRLRRINELFDKSIIHRQRIADNRHRRIVENRVALKQEKQMRIASLICVKRFVEPETCPAVEASVNSSG